MNALAIHLYLIIRHINLSFTYFGNFYRIIESYMTAITALTAFVLYSSLLDGKATPVALNIGVKSGNILGNR